MDNQPIHPPTLIITGMHRSGTSLTASLLQSAGVNIGQELMSAAQGNAKGYFENLDFVDFHERVLVAQGFAREGWTLNKDVTVPEYYLAQAKKLIQNNQADPVWGWKDPRTTLFLPFWSKLLPQAKYIFIYRSPWEVVDSLFRRGNSGDEIFTHNPSWSLELWQSYNQIVLDFYKSFNEKCILLHLNTITEAPNQLIELISQKLNISLGNCAQLFEQTHLNRSVDFHRLTILKRYFPETIDLYSILNEKSDLPYTDEQLESLVSGEMDGYINTKAWVLHDWLNIRKSEKSTKQLRTQLQQSQTELEQARTQLQQTQVDLDRSCIELQQTQAELNDSQLQLRQTQAELNKSYVQLQQTQAELNQSHLHLQQTQAELNQFYVKLQQTQAELNQSHVELQQTQTDLTQSYLKLQQAQTELNETHVKLYQAQLEARESQTQLYTTQAELQQIYAQYQLTQDELERSQAQLELTKDQLERSQVQLELTQDELERSQVQLELTRTKLQTSQAQLQQMQAELQKSQMQFEKTRTEFQQMSVHFQPTQSKLDLSQTQLQTLQGEFQHLQNQLEQARSLIAAMESSKFWRLRSLWFEIKRKLGMPEQLQIPILTQVNDTQKGVLQPSFQETGSLGNGKNLPDDYSQFPELTITEDLIGYLDLPTQNQRNQTGLLLVSGWVFSKSSQIESLFIERDNLTKEQITYGLARPDVGLQFPEIAEAQRSGFQWQLSLGTDFIGSIDIRIRAILAQTKQEICCLTRQVDIQSDWDDSLEQSKKYEDLVFVGNSNIVHAWQQQNLYRRWRYNNRLTPKLLLAMKDEATKLQLKGGVKISLLVPIYNTPKKFLKEMLQSVLAQTYPNWELCLADDASEEIHVRTILKQFMDADPRIKVTFRPENGHIVKATNSALDLATGDYIALLDHDDTLSEDALLHVAECIAKKPHLDWIYTDEDKIDDGGNYYDPQMKGGWSPEMALTHNYTHHLTVFRRSLVEQVGRLREGYEGAQDLDLFLRISEQTTPERIEHIPQVCYHWRSHRESTASGGRQKQYVFENAYRSIVEALQRRGLKARPFLPAIAEQYGMCLYQLRWDSSLLAERPVTIVIPTKDRADLLKRCISSLEKTVNWSDIKLLIIDDDSTEPEIQDYFEQLQQSLPCQVIPSNRPDDTFNYARLMNLAIKYVDTPYILHLNNDVEAIEPGWLEEMMGWMSIEGVGVVGAKLLYPDRTIQHGGVVIGSHDGLADHLFHALPKENVGYLALPHAARNASAVTGACLLTPTHLYRELGGFDEGRFAVQYNDVDYCLRVIQSGRRVVYTPQATLLHQTSASRGQDYNFEEHLNFIERYPNFQDPFFSRNLNIDSMWMEIDPYQFSHSKRAKKLKILLISHNLNLEGAPLMLYELAKFCVTQEQYQVHFLSPNDGILHQKIEDLGSQVTIVEDEILAPGETIYQLKQKLEVLGNQLNLKDYDLVIGNTLGGFWGVELANLFKVPSVWYIHESISLHLFCQSFEKSIQSLILSCFTTANRVVFVAQATRKLFHSLDIKGNFQVIHGGINLQAIESFRQTHQKSKLRRKYKIAEDNIVISIIGTTCERKGQHIFINAIQELEKINPDASSKITALIVGGRQGKYLDLLKQRVQNLNSTNISIYEETPEVYEFFHLSDIFVCASFEESFPRVILEAMAFELKIISTDVFGIPEMISHGVTGYLVKPGDYHALAKAIDSCLSDADFSARMARNGYLTVKRKFADQHLLKEHLEIIKQVSLS